jgi:mono/diheme cytochrome c family protein
MRAFGCATPQYCRELSGWARHGSRRLVPPQASFAAIACLVLAVCCLQAQEPRGNAGGRNRVRGEAAAITGAKEDPAAVERGAKHYATHCAGCHGQTARGNVGAPDLIRSIVVLTDEKGILISPILRNGRPEQGMPKPNLTEPEIADIVAWLHVQTYAAGHRNTYAFQDVVTGDAKAGEAYFNGAGGCNQCHSPTGDLKGIGGRMDAMALQQHWLGPRGRRRGDEAETGGTARKVKVTLSSGETVSGTLDRIDDFSVSLRDDSGKYQSFFREGDVPKVEIIDPLRAHLELLHKYTDADIHDVTAYLVTLK